MTSETDRSEFAAALEEDRRRVEERLVRLLDELSRGPSPIGEAVRYMVLDAGKRLRPVLCLWTHDACGGKSRDVCLDAACAIECLHTYSLIHDDLPCMDDDDMRRGRPSCHRKFGEAVAVLAGDALLTLCFDILLSMGERWGGPPGRMVAAGRVVARAAGTAGLIGGQVLDITSVGRAADRQRVDEIHRMKTAALIAASMETGAVIAEAPAEARARVRESGLLAGKAFQIIDDVLDVESPPEALGKTPGKDARDAKPTYPSVAGIEGSREEAARLIGRAKAGLQGLKTERLTRLLDFVVERRS